MLLVKLGGSVITVKSKYRTLRGPDLSRLAREIASGDDVVLELAKLFRPERVVFAADVDGVYTSDPKRDNTARRLDVVDSSTLGSISFSETAGFDVTGGLRRKLERMLAIAKYAGDVRVVNGLARGRVEMAVQGGDVVGARGVG